MNTFKFKIYADFYDSLYEDKNYQQKCNFVKHVFETYSEVLKGLEEDTKRIRASSRFRIFK